MFSLIQDLMPSNFRSIENCSVKQQCFKKLRGNGSRTNRFKFQLQIPIYVIIKRQSISFKRVNHTKQWPNQTARSMFLFFFLGIFILSRFFIFGCSIYIVWHTLWQMSARAYDCTYNNNNNNNNGAQTRGLLLCNSNILLTNTMGIVFMYPMKYAKFKYLPVFPFNLS